MHVDSVCAEWKNDYTCLSLTHTLSLSHTCFFSHTHCYCHSLSHTHTHTHTCFLSHTHTPLLSLSVRKSMCVRERDCVWEKGMCSHFYTQHTHTHTPLLLSLSSIWLCLVCSGCNHIQLTCCVLNASQPPIWLNDHSVFVSPALSDDVIVLVVITDKHSALCQFPIAHVLSFTWSVMARTTDIESKRQEDAYATQCKSSDAKCEVLLK